MAMTSSRGRRWPCGHCAARWAGRQLQQRHAVRRDQQRCAFLAKSSGGTECLFQWVLIQCRCRFPSSRHNAGVFAATRPPSRTGLALARRRPAAAVRIVQIKALGWLRTNLGPAAEIRAAHAVVVAFQAGSQVHVVRAGVRQKLYPLAPDNPRPRRRSRARTWPMSTPSISKRGPWWLVRPDRIFRQRPFARASWPKDGQRAGLL